MFDRQNDEVSLELLSAMRHLYTNARIIHRFRIGISLLIPVVSMTLGVVKEDSRPYIALVGATWLLLSRFPLNEAEKESAKSAALVQEVFDTRLFDLQWNKVLVGKPPEAEKIREAAHKFKGDINKLRNWYQGLIAPTRELNVLLAQRTNLIWDANRRESYAKFVMWLSILYIVLTIFLNWGNGIGQYILTYAIPSLAIISHGFETSNAHKQRAEQSQRIAEEIKIFYKGNYAEPDAEAILRRSREFQDFIFLRRKETTLIPELWYWYWRTFDDENMKKINERLSMDSDNVK